MKVLINKIIQKYDVQKIERHLIFDFIKKQKIDYSKCNILNKYFNKFKINDILISSINSLNISNLYDLENYLEVLIPSSDRKLNGAFFTPHFITDFIVNTIAPTDISENLDPSCGCGAFLLSLVKYFKSKYNFKIKDIINHNIYGVDILEYNINRTKIILTIFALMYDEVLEEEDFNLIVNDSLRINWERGLFKNKINKFDNIIGNPPYVKFQDLGPENREFLIKNCSVIQGGTFNLYFAFFEIGYKLLKNNGKLGYITPNNYFTSLAGESLRQYFHKKKCITHIIDFKDKKVFNAQTYTAITFMNTEENEDILFNRIKLNQKPNVFLKKLSYSKNLLADLNYKKWRLLQSDEKDNIKKIENLGTPLYKMYDILVGIATLKDKLYFLNTQKMDNKYFYKEIDNKIFKIEKGIVKHIYKISDFTNNEDIKQNSRRIIFPYLIRNQQAHCIPEKELKQNYPNCYKYFINIKEKLLQRDKGKKSILPFYAYGRSQGLVKKGKKILTPTFSQHPKFMLVFDEDALFCNGYGIYFKKNNFFNNSLFYDFNPLLDEKNIFILQKILNSFIMHYYITITSVSIEGGYPCYQKNFIEKFTIPEFNENELMQLSEIGNQEEIDFFLIKKYNLDIKNDLYECLVNH